MINRIKSSAIEKMRKVELVPYTIAWQAEYQKAALCIESILGANFGSIHHIGSTAIPDIVTKPIIDILVVVKDINQVDDCNHLLIQQEYTPMGEYGIKRRRFFYKSRKLRTHHVHIFQTSAAEIARHLKFTDYLLAHPNSANAYSTIKYNLAHVFMHDIEDYTEAKSSFIQMIEYQAGVASQAQLNAKDNIKIVAYNKKWPKLAEAEISSLKTILPSHAYIDIQHLGSTSVAGLASKPILDIYIAVESIAKAHLLIQPIKNMGYAFWDECPNKGFVVDSLEECQLSKLRINKLVSWLFQFSISTNVMVKCAAWNITKFLTNIRNAPDFVLHEMLSISKFVYGHYSRSTAFATSSSGSHKTFFHPLSNQITFHFSKCCLYLKKSTSSRCGCVHVRIDGSESNVLVF